MTSSFLIFPLMIGMIVVAEPLVEFVLTEKWLPSVPFLQIFALSYTLMPIHTANLQAINAMGRSDVFLRLEVIKKVVGMVILLVSVPFGVYAIAIGMFISNVVSSFINAYPNKILLSYSYSEQLKDMLPSFVISILMGVLVSFVKYTGLSSWRLLVVQITTGVIVYILLAKLFRIKSFAYLINTFKQLINSRKSQAV